MAIYTRRVKLKSGEVRERMFIKFQINGKMTWITPRGTQKKSDLEKIEAKLKAQALIGEHYKRAPHQAH
jgi:hypothetical protein